MMFCMDIRDKCKLVYLEKYDYSTSVKRKRKNQGVGGGKEKKRDKILNFYVPLVFPLAVPQEALLGKQEYPNRE